MTIDTAYKFIQFVYNKDQRGNFKPADFNLLAPICQLEAISDRLGNVKKLNDRLLPQYGYKSNRRIQDQLRSILVGPIDYPVSSTGYLQYPADYLMIDSLYKIDYTNIQIIDTDQYARVKQSAIIAPEDDYPIAVFHGEHIFFDPTDIGTIKMMYLKVPTEPNWDYNLFSGLPVNNSTSTPGQTGKVSVNFIGDQTFHLEICRKILKYVGVNLDSDMTTQFSKFEEQTGA